MHAFRTITSIALSSLALTGMSQAWLLEFFSTATCGSMGHADTERGGLPLQSNTCMMIMDGMRTMRLSELDDNCTVSLWPMSAGPCIGSDPAWKKSKTDLEKMGDSVVLEDGSFCVRHIPSTGYAAYVCEDDHDGSDL
ncbi:hypothetical protein K449DRAFT_439745 [Hypoxylon sp. EC38]|nr:hypothetical protein K449DRAFT_439745 [Hypoxylon sp. EC38]